MAREEAEMEKGEVGVKMGEEEVGLGLLQAHKDTACTYVSVKHTHNTQNTWQVPWIVHA